MRVHELIGLKGQRFLTEEVEFGRQRQGVTVWDKCVVSSICWLNVVDKQFMEPEKSHIQQC